MDSGYPFTILIHTITILSLYYHHIDLIQSSPHPKREDNSNTVTQIFFLNHFEVTHYKIQSLRGVFLRKPLIDEGFVGNPAPTV